MTEIDSYPEPDEGEDEGVDEYGSEFCSCEWCVYYPDDEE